MIRRNRRAFVRRLIGRVVRFRGTPSGADSCSAQDPADSSTARSADLRERRYAAGSDAGAGSRGRLARFKADIVNRFSDWIASHRPDWIQISHVANRYPFDPADPDNTSDADFFIFGSHSV